MDPPSPGSNVRVQPYSSTSANFVCDMPHISSLVDAKSRLELGRCMEIKDQLWELWILVTEGRNCEKVCEACYINKCAIYGSFSPGGVRIGIPAVTSRGCLEDDFLDHS